MSASSGAKGIGVKARGASAPRASGIARHFEGWEPGLLALFLAGTSAAVAVPRAVDPVEVPEPLLAPRALAQVAEAEDALAAKAERDTARGAPLPFEVRALGSALAAYGLAEAGGDDVEITRARELVTEAVRAARARGDGPLLALRAYETRAFLRALRVWEGQRGERKAPKELVELAGTFVETAAHHGWVKGRALAMDEAVRRAMFKKRWGELTLLRGPGFDLALDEQRALYRFLLAHPPADQAEPVTPIRGLPAAGSERAAFLAEQYRLRKIEELGRVDPSYPVELARGVVFYRMRSYPAAKDHLSRHLDAHPDGPYAQRATNYLRASLAHAVEDVP